MRSLTSDNEGALPTLTRGRPRVTDTSQNVTLGVSCHEAEAGKESPANIVTRTESGLMFADNKDITENDSLAACVNVNILCLGDPLLVGNLNIFLFIQKGYDSLSNIGLRCLFFILFPVLWMTCVMQDRGKQLIRVTPEWCRGHHLSSSGVITS